MNEIDKRIDAYFKRTIINAVKNFKRDEENKIKREVSIDELSGQSNNIQTTLLSYKDNDVVFSLEDYTSDEKLARILKELTDEEKLILTKSIIEGLNSKELTSIISKSDSRIRHIIKDTLDKIRNKYNEREG